MIQFNCKQKEEYLGKKKSIEQAVISDQLRGQSQSVVEIPVNCDSLTLLEKNKAARMSILDVSASGKYFLFLLSPPLQKIFVSLFLDVFSISK
jgi:hypothetical protein